MKKKIGLCAFILLGLLTIIMGYATWDEHINGSRHAYSLFYNSGWFTILWLVMTVISCYYIAISSLHKRLSVFLLHLAFVFILVGAFTTRISSKNGQVHLRKNQQIATFFDPGSHKEIAFSFSLSLKSFEIEYYPGTDSPSNYVSVVEVKDAKKGESFERIISMNNILRYKGYRFYQASFDEDWNGSILSVNHDTWGITLSYIGYFLMFFSMLFILFDKRERFRYLSKKLSQKAVLVVMLLCIPFFSNAQTVLIPDSIIVSKQQAEQLGKLWVDYQGRICPIQTLANDFTVKLIGKPRYKTVSSEQVFFGWLFYGESWQHIPMFEIKSKELKDMADIGDNYASLADFTDSNGRNKLELYYRQMYGSNKTEGWLKEAVKLNDKFHLIEMLQHGRLLKIFPMKNENGNIQWYSPTMQIPPQEDKTENAFAWHILPMYYEALQNGNDEEANKYVDALLVFQEKQVNDILPSDTHLKAELLNNKIRPFYYLFMVCLTIGFLCLFYFIYSTIRSKSYPKIENGFYIVLWIVFCIATIGIALRTYVGGRMPMSNSYETMILLSWLSMLTGILTRRYSFLIVVFSFLLGGFTLLVAHISSMNPQITPLMPVLRSPLLSIHVLTIMVSYGLTGFMALNSITSFAVWFFGGKKTDRVAYVERMKETSELFMFPAAFLLGAGIFIGAIWANVSWGRYWGWDPKEVWALITFLLMGFTFHKKALKWFNNPLFYHAFVLVILLAVLMTYFGVNYILGGRHSYA
ncbi:MAG: cytochrome c biogenesis protein CcsA [Tannerellaceae bacterium]|jgi:ABC-type transport system involved in cytochrome c biogenesis permease subunit|nr:cytochrome c biogenesis protein CcsA [Tannerellaceae bacterium]